MPTKDQKGPSKADRAHEFIIQGISEGRYGPGDRLVLAQIAQELDMSVVPVREAIRRLQSDRLVIFERNVGAKVVGIDPVEYRNTMETLALVEGFSTAQCAPQVTEATIAKARGINQQMVQLLEDDGEDLDAERFTTLNQQFHSALFEHHQNPHILELVHRGWNRLATLRSSTFSYVPSRAAESVTEHEELLQLIEARADFSTIEYAARQHRLKTLWRYLESAEAPEASEKPEAAEDSKALV